MKIGKITTNVYNPVAKMKKSESSAVSNVSFKGYSKQIADKCVETGGLCVTIDKGWHADIKKVTDIENNTIIKDDKVFLRYRGPQYAYYADCEETINLDDFSHSDIKCVVEYVKPKEITAHNTYNAIFGNSEVNFDKSIEYVWGQKDKEQKEYQGLCRKVEHEQDSYIADELKKHLKAKEASLYFLDKRIEAYNELQGIVDLAGSYRDAEQSIDKYHQIYLDDKALLDSINENISIKQKEHDEAPKCEKEEKELELFMAQDKMKRVDYQIEKKYQSSKGPKFDSLESRMLYYKDKYETSRALLESLGDEMTVEDKLNELYNQAKRIYARTFPESYNV